MVSSKLIPTIKVLLTCDSCGLKDFPVQLRSRLPKEDVIKWMNEVVTIGVGKAHMHKSPHCMVKELTNIKIPINKEDGSYIGQPIN